MFRFLIGLLFLSSCSLGVIKSGGEKTYVYDASRVYTLDELKELSPGMIQTSYRDPQKGTLDQLFSDKQKPLKRVGILVFEAVIQPTRAGLAGDDKVYLSPTGKQLLTEKFLNIWEQSFSLLGEDVEIVRTSAIKKSKAFMLDGMDVQDWIITKHETLAPDDIFFVEKGKDTTPYTLFNARGMRDLSLALVPAAEMMNGPKFSEHAKHTVNEVAKELNLDAVIIVMNNVYWTAAHTDKHTGEVFPEEAVVNIEASILVPLSSYTQRLKNIGEQRVFPNNTISYRAYESTLKFPVTISVPVEKQTFMYVQHELTNPILKTYTDLAQMFEIRMVQDLKKTIH